VITSQGGTAIDLNIKKRSGNGQLMLKAKDNHSCLQLCLCCAQNGHLAIHCLMIVQEVQSTVAEPFLPQEQSGKE
jgi:hypothetical protein